MMDTQISFTLIYYLWLILYTTIKLICLEYESDHIITLMETFNGSSSFLGENPSFLAHHIKPFLIWLLHDSSAFSLLIN